MKAELGVLLHVNAWGATSEAVAHAAGGAHASCLVILNDPERGCRLTSWDSLCHACTAVRCACLNPELLNPRSILLSNPAVVQVLRLRAHLRSWSSSNLPTRMPGLG